MDKVKILNEIQAHYNFKNTAEFARFLGVDSQNIRNWYNRNNYNSNLLIEKCMEINPNYIITGEGSLLKESKIINNTKGVPYYDVDFLGGFDLLCNDQTINPEYMIDFSLYNKADCWCNISGHSMEPEITHGDIIALKEVVDWQTFLPFGEIYGIIASNGMRTIKRVRAGEDREHFKLIPTNLANFDVQEIAICEIVRVFKVLGSMKRF